jgi:peptide/nickel transport system substrate-binding protein
MASSHRPASRRSLVWPTLAALIALMAVAGLLSVGASAKTQAASQSSTPLVINSSQAPATLDPGAGCLAPEVGFIANFYARLTQYGTKPGPNGTRQVDPSNLNPWVAKSWTISPNGLTYTFKIRTGLKFPSGKPVNAAAVKYSLDRSIKMALCGSAFVLDNRFSPLVIKSVAAPDAQTVVLHLSGQNQNMLQDLAMPGAGIVDPSVVEAHGGVKAGKINPYMASHVAGYGPFLLQSYQANKSAVLVANPTFFDPPKSKKIIVNFISSDPTLLLNARSGKADVTLGLTKQSINSLKSNSCCRIVANDGPFAQQVVFNNTKAPFTNKTLREALTYAVPYKDILSRIVYGYGKLFYGEWVPYFPWYNAKIGQPRAYDLKKAQALIAKSGVKTPINIGLLLPEGDNVGEQVATTLQGLWRQIGVNVTINKATSADYINTLNAHKFQAAMYLDGPGVIAPDYYWGYDATCGIVYSYTLFCSKPADKMIRQLWTTTNPKKRQQLTDAANKLWIAGSPAIKVYADKYVAVLSPKVKGYVYSHLPEFRGWSR